MPYKPVDPQEVLGVFLSWKLCNVPFPGFQMIFPHLVLILVHNVMIG